MQSIHDNIDDFGEDFSDASLFADDDVGGSNELSQLRIAGDRGSPKKANAAPRTKKGKLEADDDEEDIDLQNSSDEDEDEVDLAADKIVDSEDEAYVNDMVDSAIKDDEDYVMSSEDEDDDDDDDEDEDEDEEEEEEDGDEDEDEEEEDEEDEDETMAIRPPPAKTDAASPGKSTKTAAAAKAAVTATSPTPKGGNKERVQSTLKFPVTDNKSKAATLAAAKASAAFGVPSTQSSSSSSSSSNNGAGGVPEKTDQAKASTRLVFDPETGDNLDLRRDVLRELGTVHTCKTRKTVTDANGKSTRKNMRVDAYLLPDHVGDVMAFQCSSELEQKGALEIAREARKRVIVDNTINSKYFTWFSHHYVKDAEGNCVGVDNGSIYPVLMVSVEGSDSIHYSMVKVHKNLYSTLATLTIERVQERSKRTMTDAQVVRAIIVNKNRHKRPMVNIKTGETERVSVPYIVDDVLHAFANKAKLPDSMMPAIVPPGEVKWDESTSSYVLVGAESGTTAGKQAPKNKKTKSAASAAAAAASPARNEPKKKKVSSKKRSSRSSSRNATPPAKQAPTKKQKTQATTSNGDTTAAAAAAALQEFRTNVAEATKQLLQDVMKEEVRRAKVITSICQKTPRDPVEIKKLLSKIIGSKDPVVAPFRTVTMALMFDAAETPSEIERVRAEEAAKRNEVADAEDFTL